VDEFIRTTITELLEMRAVLGKDFCAASAATTFDEAAGAELTLIVKRLTEAQGNRICARPTR